MAVRGQHRHLVSLADTHLLQGIRQTIDPGRKCAVGVTPFAIDDGDTLSGNSRAAPEEKFTGSRGSNIVDPFKLRCMHSLHFISPCGGGYGGAKVVGSPSLAALELTHLGQ